MQPTERHFLANGLKILLRQQRTAPVVSMAMWVDVGSADEAPHEAGLAHVHEHMLFKGTARRGVGEIARTVEACGGHINAFTSFDHTVYYLTLSSRFFEQGLDILCDAIRHSAFDPEELERELEVILEEIKRGEDSPSRVRSQQLFSLSYQVHPYSRPVIGTRESVSSFTREDVLSFYQKWYVPKNMTLVVVGDIDPDEALKAIEAQMGTMEPGQPPPKPRPEEPTQASPRIDVRAGEVMEVLASAAFHVPGVGHEDGPPLDVLRLLLSYGDSARLVERLERQLQWSNDIQAGAYMPRDPGLFMVTSDHMPAPDHPGVGAVLEAALGVLSEMATRPISAEEVRRAQTLLESSQIHQRQTVEGQAMVLGSYEVIAGGFEREDGYFESLRLVTPERIQEVVRRYFTPENLSVTVYGPAEVIDALDTTEVLDAALRGLAGRSTIPGPRASVALERDDHQTVRVDLEDGPVLIIQEDRSVPLVSVRNVFMGGLRLETPENVGLHQLMSSLWTRGTRARTLTDIAREVEGMGSGLDAYCGRNTVGIQMELLASHFTRAMGLMADCLIQPLFDPALLEIERRLTLESIQARADNLGAVSSSLTRRALFGDHPYAMDVLGEAASVTALTREQIVSAYQRHIQPERMVLSVVGDVLAEEVVEWVAERFSPPTRFLDAQGPTDPLPTLSLAPLDRAQVVAGTLNKQQASVSLAFRAADMDDPDGDALSLLSAILSGQGGRLFLELRDRQSLAYSVFSQYVAGMEVGSFSFHIATSPEKIGQAIEGLLGQVHSLLDSPVLADEIERAQRYLVGNHDIQLQSFSTRSMQMALDALYGHPHDDYLNYAERLMALTPQRLQEAAARWLDPARCVLTLVHPNDADLPSMERFGLPDPIYPGASRP